MTNQPAATASGPDKQPFTSEQWEGLFARAGRSEPLSVKVETDAAIASQFVGQFGFQNAAEVTAFLRTPEGKAVEAEISEELAAIEAIAREQQQANESEQRLKSLLMLALKLISARKAEAAQITLDGNQVLRDKLLKQDKDTAPPPPKANDALANDVDKSLLAEENKILENTERELRTLEGQKTHTETKYRKFESGVDEVSQLEDLKEIEDCITDLTQKIDNDVAQVHTHLENGEEEQGQALLEESNANNIKIAALKDIVDVFKGEKHLYNTDGNWVKSFNEAAFMLHKKYKIEKDETGEAHLIKNGESLSSMNPEQKKEAAEAFQQIKNSPEAVPVKKLLQQNCGLEMRGFDARIKGLSTQQNATRAKIALLNDRLNRLNTMQTTSTFAATNNLSPPTSTAALRTSDNINTTLPPPLTQLQETPAPSPNGVNKKELK